MRIKPFAHLLSLVVFALMSMTAVPLLAQHAVVVELFTSEGCSSCPPADALLGQLTKQRSSTSVELILLGEHVEYWNGQGWTDRFSAPVFTQRQYDYVHRLHLATAYTPQVIVDGHLQGSGVQCVRDQGECLPRQHARRSLQPSRSSSSPLTSYRFRLRTPATPRQRVLLAVTEDNLTTKVGGGENGGAAYSFTVRSCGNLHELGTVSNGRLREDGQSPRQARLEAGRSARHCAGSGRQRRRHPGAASLPYTAHSAAAAGR